MARPRRQGLRSRVSTCVGMHVVLPPPRAHVCVCVCVWGGGVGVDEASKACLPVPSDAELLSEIFPCMSLPLLHT